MAAGVLAEPPGIDCVFSDGRRTRAVVGTEPALLVRDLLAGLAGWCTRMARSTRPAP